MPNIKRSKNSSYSLDLKSADYCTNKQPRDKKTCSKGPIWQSNEQWKKEVLFCRCVAIAVVLLCMLNIQYLDNTLSQMWIVCLNSSFFKWDTFEPAVVSITFTICLSTWRIVDQFIPPEWVRKYKLHDTTYDDLKGWWENPGDLVSTTIPQYVIPLLIIDYIFPRREGWITAEPPTFYQVVTETIYMLFIYDLCFTMFHVLFHKIPFLYKKVHAVHHCNPHTHAIETFRLTFIEQWIDIGCSILAVNLSKSHLLSRVFYNVLIVYLLTELHSGYNFPFMISNIAPGGFVGGSLEHNEHHRTGKHYFGKYFTYLDYIMGSTKALK
eukprot:Pgem_evm1s5830